MSSGKEAVKDISRGVVVLFASTILFGAGLFTVQVLTGKENITAPMITAAGTATLGIVSMSYYGTKLMDEI